jgi:HAMP domain-containing protein
VIGPVRRSTVLIAVAFLAVLLLYLWVRPGP